MVSLYTKLKSRSLADGGQNGLYSGLIWTISLSGETMLKYSFYEEQGYVYGDNAANHPGKKNLFQAKRDDRLKVGRIPALVQNPLFNIEQMRHWATGIVSSWLSTNIKLENGASLSEIFETENDVGIRLPISFVELYKTANGFKDWDMNQHMISI